MRHTTLHLAKEDFKFSSGHFTIFSATERENLHGHNFRLEVAIDCAVGADGLAFDYAIAKRAIRAFCAGLDEVLLLPGDSPHLRIETADDMVRVTFAGTAMLLPARDVRILPLANITVEELARHAAASLHVSLAADPGRGIRALRARVSSGPGQAAEAGVDTGSG
jgi:6-pyruvoyltetrahydropterin/6-carboxytetrahydropterin synthase